MSNNLIQHLSIGMCSVFFFTLITAAGWNANFDLSFSLSTLRFYFSDILLVFIFTCVVNLAAALPIPEDAGLSTGW